MKKNIQFLILYLAFPLLVNAQQIELPSYQLKLGISAMQYSSYSQQKTSMRMKIGYPVFHTNTFNLNASLHLNHTNPKQVFNLETSLPSKLNADNGSGANLILNSSKSNYFRSDFTYGIQFLLLKWSKIEINHGLKSGLLYEYRKLNSLSDVTESTSDLNFYLGPQLTGTINFKQSLKSILSFDAGFHLPYFNIGQLINKDANNQIFFKSSYHGFYYQTTTGIMLIYHRFEFGGFMNNIVGYANSEMSFSTEGIIHHKLDRIYFIKLGYRL